MNAAAFERHLAHTTRVEIMDAMPGDRARPASQGGITDEALEGLQRDRVGSLAAFPTRSAHRGGARLKSRRGFKAIGTSHPGAWKAGLLILAAASLAAPPHAARGRPIEFPSGSYSYVVIDQDLRDLLTEFGHTLNFVVQLSDEVHGRVRGPLPVSTAQEFLNRICDRFGLVWYYDGSVLFISAQTELRTELIDIGKAPPKTMSDKLASLDIIDPRFPVTVTADPAMLSVSGPPPYLSRLRETATLLVRSLARPLRMGDDDRVRVFRGGS